MKRPLGVSHGPRRAEKQTWHKELRGKLCSRAGRWYPGARLAQKGAFLTGVAPNSVHICLSYISLQFWKVSLNSVSKGMCLLSVFSLEVLPPAVTNSCADSFNNHLVDVVSELGEGRDRISMGHRKPLPARTACFLSCLYRTTSCRCVASGVLRVKVIKRNPRFGEKVFIPLGRCRGPN